MTNAKDPSEPTNETPPPSQQEKPWPDAILPVVAPLIAELPSGDAPAAGPVHVQASANWTGCGLSVDGARLAEVGDTVDCPECVAWLNADDDEKTPARGITMAATGKTIPVEVEMTLDKDPIVQIAFDVTLPDGKRVRVDVPQTVVDVLHQAWSPDTGPHRLSWRWPGAAVELEPKT